ncbi:hypothetical protein L4C36_19170 [Photobacterium japonica]|uniref:hypothetical protein n=1 Tax=Photobacterium japonica TaxID=2910235 RepID=UPI003D0A930F
MTQISGTIQTLLNDGDKRTRLAALTQRRRESTPDEAYAIGDFYFGAYETEWVSPYTKSASNLHATVMVLLQDWASNDYLAQVFRPALASLGLDPKLPTSQHLNMLLRRHLGLALNDTYATNVYPFIKKGSLSAAMTWRGILEGARRYALPQIQIIAPKIVICLGLNVFNAISVANGGVRYKRLEAAITTPFCLALENGHCCYVFAQAHTGFHGQTSRNRITRQQVDLDWASMITHLPNIMT